MNKRKYEIKGITLVALVITIIVLLILAGISIAMLTGENGILSRAQEVIGKSENSQIEENKVLADYENRIGATINSSRAVTEKEYQELLKRVEELEEENKNLKETTPTVTSIASTFLADNSLASYTYTATKKGKVLLTLVTARGTDGTLATNFYCKKNNVNQTAINTAGDNYRRMSSFAIDVNSGDIIEFKAQSTGYWGDSGYTLYFIE